MKLEQSKKAVIKHFCREFISLMAVTYNASQQQNYPMKIAQKLTKKCVVASRIRRQKFSLSLGLVCEILVVRVRV